MNVVYSAPSTIFAPPQNCDNAKIFVGNSTDSMNLKLLQDNTILGVLNVAFDCDDNATQEGFENIVYAKVGLIDGFGNTHLSLIAGVYAADQLFTFGNHITNCSSPTLTKQRGNLLIHCCSGHSRSVTIAALYIWYKFGIFLKDSNISIEGSPIANFLKVYNMVKTAQNDSLSTIDRTDKSFCFPPEIPSNWSLTGIPHNEYSYPTIGMQVTAYEIVEKYSSLFPVPTLR